MATGGLPAFDHLLAPTPAKEFIRRYWERQPFLAERHDAGHYGNLFDRGQLHRLLSYTFVSRRDGRVVKNGAVDPELTVFDSEGIANPLAMMSAYADGFTIVVNNLQSRHREISYLCRAVENVFRQPVGANAYLTPPQSQGLAPHFDDHDVFVLQIEGEKTWRIYDTAVDLPLRGQHVNIDASQLGPPARVCRLQPGGLLYLPRGVVHDATATKVSSLHLTLGLSCFRWADALTKMVELCARKNVAWRKSIPPRAEQTAFESAVPELDGLMSDLKTDFEGALKQIDVQFIKTLAPLDDGGLEHIDTLKLMTLDSKVRQRIGSICHVEETPDESRIYFPGNTVVGPCAIASAFRFVAQQPAFAPRDLPDSLDDDSKVNIVRKLVATGLLVPLREP
jgi:ribosomal protein L16 Arg81 hydroxylase